MTKLGWIAAVLLVLQAHFFAIVIPQEQSTRRWTVSEERQRCLDPAQSEHDRTR